ncbi:MAG TPA: hypothetical protein VK432_02600 [Stellaceae bacterium]|nr:hypothetical protein [Stellaceae bacterium]
MRAQGTSGGLPDREIWRRSQEIEAPVDEAEQLLDLAAFADYRLDDDETARLAARIARDADADGDVAAARLMASATMEAAAPDVIARATLLVGDDPVEAQVIAFPARQPQGPSWFGAVRWSGLAAAMVLAGWLGFNLGSGLPGVTPVGHTADEGAPNELFDPVPPLILRDFSENSQI